MTGNPQLRTFTERAMPSPRRFPPPWSVEELDACYVARDHDGQALAYVYFEDEPGGFNTTARSRRRPAPS
jgi:hypothetical protein